MKNRERLEAELRAIERWDALYRKTPPHNKAEDLSYWIRQERRLEVLKEIQHSPDDHP